MAPGVIYLDADDEITSAAARIRSVDAPQIAVVLPYGSHLATSRINFRLLARDALAHEKELSIVAGDAAVRALAASAGLPVFRSVAEYEASLDASRAGPDRRTAGRPSGSRDAQATGIAVDPGGVTQEHARRRSAGEPRSARSMPGGPVSSGRGSSRTPILVGILVLGLAVIVGGVAAFLLLPAATVVVTAREETIGPLSFSVAGRTDVASPDAATALVPAEKIAIDVEASDAFPATGVRVERTRARGSVRFLSKDFTAANTIEAGSIVRTASGVRFRTNTTIRLPPAALNGLQITPSSLSVGVTAIDPGPDGNVEARSINVLPKGKNPLFLEVTNPGATSGGKRTEFARVTQEDLDNAVAALTTSLGGAFRTRLADPELAAEGATVLPASARLGEPVVATDLNELLGSEVETFELSASLSATVMAVDASPVRSIAEARLRSQVRPGHMLVAGSGSVDVDPPIVAGESITFPVVASARETAVLDPLEIESSILGQPLDQARATLDRYGPAEIRVWPDWVGAIPTMEDRVEVSIEAPASGPPDPSAAPGQGSS
ncbi:MAG: baseplate J/gp47 family protein [Candidatus Limnocylindrales bacterium]